MIEFKVGNLLNEDVEAIVNTVNCVGVMGRGIALQFKKQFPDNYKKYNVACKHEEIQPGKMYVFETKTLTNPKYIINFPTKRHWRGASRMTDIETGLSDLVRVINEKNIESIALPPLGCGLGGLEWSVVKDLIKSKMTNIPNTRIIIFEPQISTTPQKIVSNIKVPNMTPGRAALIELIYRYLGGLLVPFVTLLEIHKLMYFMQESGEKLQLKYKKAIYGPYAENLRHVLNAIEGHFISGYADGGDSPNKQLLLVPGAINEASQFLNDHHNTKKNFDKVVDLVDGFESPFGLELLSTVHWIMKYNDIHSESNVIEYVYQWSERKKQFTSNQINLAITVLLEKGWVVT